MLLAPERLISAAEATFSVDLSDPRYAECYEEMDFYNRVATVQSREVAQSEPARRMAWAARATEAERASFPEPWWKWLEARFEAVAEWEGYRHLAPLAGKTVLQFGGKGTHAVRFLVAGASAAWVMSPMLEELSYARDLAREFGVADRLGCVAGIAEEMPFVDGVFDAIYTESSLHHTLTSLAFSESHRVLRSGGTFAAVEPWQAPLYDIGIRIFGKREPQAHCRPLTAARVEALSEVFEQSEVRHHGTLTRYPSLALARLGMEFSLTTLWNLTRLDDAICARVPRLRTAGSSSVLLATRQAR